MRARDRLQRLDRRGVFALAVPALLAMAALGVQRWPSPSTQPPGIRPEAPAPGASRDGAPTADLAPVAAAAPAASARPPVPAASLEPLPEFMREIPVIGGLEVDADGHFVPTVSARQLIQYFLLAAGREPDVVIRGRVVVEIWKRLPAGAAAEATAFLDRFLALRAELAPLAQQESDPRRRFERVRELRRQVLGPDVAEVLFGEDEQAMQVEFNLRAIREDASLSPEERRRRLDDAERELPAQRLAARQAMRAPLRVQDEVEAMRARGASTEEVFAVREGAFGREAAERLAAFDAEQARWQAAWSTYRQARDALLEDPRPTPDERVARVQSLRQSLFTEGELARVRLLDEIDARGRAARPAAP